MELERHREIFDVLDAEIVPPRLPLKKFTVVVGNSDTYNYVADRIVPTPDGKWFHFMEGDSIVGIKAQYGVTSISDQPFTKRY